MVETFSLSDLGRWLLTLLRRIAPDRILRWAWSDQELLARIEAFHFSQSPRLQVNADRDTHELHQIGFNVFNFSPIALAIVGVDLRVSLDSRELLRYDHRFSAEIRVPAWARSGFHFQHALTAFQAERLQKYPHDFAYIRIDGQMILRTPFGERRKDISADIVAVIDR